MRKKTFSDFFPDGKALHIGSKENRKYPTSVYIDGVFDKHRVRLLAIKGNLIRLLDEHRR